VTTTRVRVPNPSGLHARPAALFVRTAGGFRSKITVRNLDRGEKQADAKSILGIMTLGVAQGAEIEMSADGDDADDAIAALRDAVLGGLGEQLDTSA
jgi:phosphotransferase system HPr (HPr) family protein